MKKNILVLSIIAALISLSTLSFAADSCITLKDGTLKYSAGHRLVGQPLKIGYDAYGYNYQAHMFLGTFANVYLGRDGFPPYTGNDDAYLLANPTAVGHWAWPYRADQVAMKWNDAWLSNKDCDGDGKLDRHLGFATYIGSDAWLTNHNSGEDMTYGEGETPLPWTQFIKIIAAPANAVCQGTEQNVYWDFCTWSYPDGAEIGPSIWGEMAVIQDQGEGIIPYRSPSGPGFGKFGKE